MLIIDYFPMTACPLLFYSLNMEYSDNQHMLNPVPGLFVSQ